MNADQDELQAGFDQWSARYDRDVTRDGAFPFDGYDRVLARVLELATVASGHQVLELAPGTGNLTRQLLDAGAEVWGIDFSPDMLAIARQKAPEAVLLEGNLLEPLPPALQRRFDCIVGTYILHEFPLPEKVALVERLVGDHLAPGGRLIFGDIGFRDKSARSLERERAGALWSDEYYWLADETAQAFEPLGLDVQYEQLSSCGCVISMNPLPLT